MLARNNFLVAYLLVSFYLYYNPILSTTCEVSGIVVLDSQYETKKLQMNMELQQFEL